MIFTILISAVFFAGAAVFLLRLAGEAGFRLPARVDTVIRAKTLSSPESTTAKECAYIFAAAFLFRVLIFVSGWAAYGIFSDGPACTFLEYCGRWNLWDGPHYVEIAADGYAHVEDGQHLFLVFFPLYPMLMRLMGIFVRNYAVSGILTSMLCYSGGCVLMYKLVSMDYGKSAARTSIILLSVSPFAFFFGAVMTEGAFFLFVTAVFLEIRKHNWLAAGILGIFASLTRSFGVFMVITAAIEWIQSERPVTLFKEKGARETAKRALKLLPAALMPIGTLIYLYINYKVEGDPFAFMKYQSEHWSQNLQFFPKTLNMLSSRAFSGNEEWMFRVSMFIPGLLSAAFASAAVLIGARRLRLSDTSFMIAYFIFNVGASWPLSLPRYMACMFPAYWLIASMTEKHKHAQQIMTAASAVLFGIYLAGYLTSHNIM